MVVQRVLVLLSSVCLGGFEFLLCRVFYYFLGNKGKLSSWYEIWLHIYIYFCSESLLALLDTVKHSKRSFESIYP